MVLNVCSATRFYFVRDGIILLRLQILRLQILPPFQRGEAGKVALDWGAK